MNPTKQEIIGSFAVVNSELETKKIIVCQDIITHYSDETCSEKTFYLDFVDGIKVCKTIDPNIFKLPDGSKLRKRRR